MPRLTIQVVFCHVTENCSERCDCICQKLKALFDEVEIISEVMMLFVGGVFDDEEFSVSDRNSQIWFVGIAI